MTDNNYKSINVLKNNIEKINSVYHIDFFNIIKKHNLQYSENRNGIFINISNIDKHIITELSDKIKYIHNQEENLNDIEQQKNNYKNKLFNNIKANKDI